MSTFRFIRDNIRWLMAGALLSLMSSFGQTFFISIFAGEIRDTFGLSNGAWGGIYMIGTTASAVAMVWAGGLTDRFRARVLAPFILGLLALACLAMSVANSVVVLVAVIFALRFCGQGMSSHIAIVSMTRWFAANRGKALAFATLGFACGEALLPIGFVALKPWIDWHILWRMAAGLILVGLVVLLILLRTERTPQSWASSDHSAGMGGRHWTRHEAIRHWLFWIMLPALMAPPAFGTAFMFHQVAFAEAKGWAHIDLVKFFPLYTAVAVGSGLVWGWALDRVGPGRLMPFSHLPAVVAFTLFGLAETPGAAGLGLAFYAVTTGAQATLPSAFWAEHFGTRHIGSIKAALMAAMVFGSAAGPGATGALLDAGVTLSMQYTFVAVWFLCGAALMWVATVRARPLLAVAP